MLEFARLIYNQPTNDLTNPECYVQAGYKVKTVGDASGSSSRLLKHPKVVTELSRLRVEHNKPDIITRDQILKLYADVVNSEDESTRDKLAAGKHILTMQAWEEPTLKQKAEIKKINIEIEAGTTLLEDVKTIKEQLSEARKKPA